MTRIDFTDIQWEVEDTIDVAMMYLVLVILVGLLCNYNWILSASSMAITILTTLFYYILVYNYEIFMIHVFIIAILIVVVYAVYTIEKNEKQMCQQVCQITKMNDDVNRILMNLPEGVLLINDKKRVTLGNFEFCRLFGLEINDE